MRGRSWILPVLLLAQPVVAQAPSANVHYPMAAGPLPPGAVAPGAGPVFSAAVMGGDTLYLSGASDLDPATGRPPADPKVAARLILDTLQRTLVRAGMTMDDLVWVQVFATDLGEYGAFNEVYRTYFKGPLPARAFLGAGSLLAGSHFEVTGIAHKAK